MTLPNPFLSAEQHPLSAETAPAADAWNPEAAGATDHIHEIFHHARKLCEHRFVLDEQAFMDAIEDIPLFLRMATG